MPKKILIIDDDAPVREMLREALTDFGYDVTAASSGEEGLARIEAGLNPDLLITDIIMPRIDGLQVIAAVRAKNPAMKLLAISGGGRTKTGDFLAQAQALGCTEVLPKPLDMAALEALVERLVG